MKNNRKVAALLLVSFLLIFGACQQRPKQEEPTEPVSPPKGIISLEESKSLYDNYTKHRMGMIQEYELERKPDEKFVPARLSSFSFAEMKQYMAYVEQEAKKAQVEVSSLRFYFANYPDNERFPDGDKVVHPRQNSIFIVPTMKVDGQDYGFYIGADGKAKLIKDAMGENGMGYKSAQGEKSQASFVPNLSLADDGESLNLNHGNSEPPPYTLDFQ